MTQEEITKEYGQICGTLGERVYRLFVPFLEIHQMMSRMMGLNHEAWKLKQAEAEKKTEPEKTPEGLEESSDKIGTDVA